MRYYGLGNADNTLAIKYLSDDIDWVTWSNISNDGELNDRLSVSVENNDVVNVCRYNAKKKEICSQVKCGDHFDLVFSNPVSFNVYDKVNKSYLVEW